MQASAASDRLRSPPIVKEQSDRAPAVLSKAGARCLGRASEQTRFSSASERGRQRPTSASLSERSEQWITNEGTRLSSPERSEP
jgi:hypothetical protein